MRSDASALTSDPYFILSFSALTLNNDRFQKHSEIFVLFCFLVKNLFLVIEI